MIRSGHTPSLKMNKKTDTCQDFFAKIYYAAVPEDVSVKPVSDRWRQAEIDKITNIAHRAEKYCAWRLLEYALQDLFKKDSSALGVCRRDYGGYGGEGVELSVSHTKGLVAVGVSRNAIGVDAERLGGGRVEKLAERFLTEREFSRYRDTDESRREIEFLRLWCAKEAVFKSQKKEIFVPSALDGTAHSVRIEEIEVASGRYVLAVAGEGCERSAFSFVSSEKYLY